MSCTRGLDFGMTLLSNGKEFLTLLADFITYFKETKEIYI